MYALLSLLAGTPPPPPDISWYMTREDCINHGAVRQLQFVWQGRIIEYVSCTPHRFPSRWNEEPIPDLDRPPRRPGQ